MQFWGIPEDDLSSSQFLLRNIVSDRAHAQPMIGTYLKHHNWYYISWGENKLWRGTWGEILVEQDMIERCYLRLSLANTLQLPSTPSRSAPWNQPSTSTRRYCWFKNYHLGMASFFLFELIHSNPAFFSKSNFSELLAKKRLKSGVKPSRSRSSQAQCGGSSVSAHALLPLFPTPAGHFFPIKIVIQSLLVLSEAS